MTKKQKKEELLDKAISYAYNADCQDGKDRVTAFYDLEKKDGSILPYYLEQIENESVSVEEFKNEIFNVINY
jgi:hypothetical protein